MPSHRYPAEPGACPRCTKRQFLGTGAGLLAAGGASLLAPARAMAQGSQAPFGATDDFQPYPIPWLNKNLHHNQTPPTPGSLQYEPSHIFNFNGDVGRAPALQGQGQANDGRTLYFSAGTDYGYMQGQYITASGDMKLGVFTHI